MVMPLTASITKRKRRRRLKSGNWVVQTRFVVNFREPRTGKRKQFFFERHKDALTKRDALISSIVTRTYAEARGELTVAQAFRYWIESRRGEVKTSTLKGYRQAAPYIVGPLLVGSPKQRRAFAASGEKPRGTELLEMLGAIRIEDLTTADIRRWHQTLSGQISSYTARVARKYLRAALALAAEDFLIRMPPMPAQAGKRRTKPKKSILTTRQISRLLEAAVDDRLKGIYYAFPFLTGVRPSEQLALLWRDISFSADVIHIRRMQEQDGSISDFTKTAAGNREIPMSPLLRSMLARWRGNCPGAASAEGRVFPGLGRPGSPHSHNYGAGRPLSYANFLANYWRPAFAPLGLPYVTPHSARHAFISTLQAQGIEVGLVAKLAGHANATVTLRHYTHAMRGGEAAVDALDRAYSVECGTAGALGASVVSRENYD
jgi:integrase